MSRNSSIGTLYQKFSNQNFPKFWDYTSSTGENGTILTREFPYTIQISNFKTKMFVFSTTFNLFGAETGVAEIRQASKI